jgi:hypothetical protein
LLAIEEMGKAGLITSREASARNRDNGWIDKRLDDHAFKLLWGLWSPTFADSREFDPESFRQIKEFSERAHLQRLAGLVARWRLNVRVYCISHSIRPRTLNAWNENIHLAKLKFVNSGDRVDDAGRRLAWNACSSIITWRVEAVFEMPRLLAREFLARAMISCDAKR